MKGAGWGQFRASMPRIGAGVGNNFCIHFSTDLLTVYGSQRCPGGFARQGARPKFLLRAPEVVSSFAVSRCLASSRTPTDGEDLKKQGVSGALGGVHGGGFYRPGKFAVSPPKLPGHLH